MQEQIDREWFALTALCNKLGYTEELFWTGILTPSDAPFA